MQAFPYKLFLFIAVFMFAAKPFVGFSMYKQLQMGNRSTILVKAFTKRKQEYIENGQFDIQSIIKRLADPLDALALLFTCLLTIILPAVLSQGKSVTNRLLNDIHLSLFPPQQLYLLSGKLSI